MGDPCMNSWDALLSSARGLLQSARTSSRSTPCSARGSARGSARKPGNGANEQVSTTKEPALESSVLGTLSGQAQGSPDPSQGPSSTGPSCEDVVPPVARADVLARLAEISETEDTEAMRSFVRNFLLGVRRRWLKGDMGQSAADEDEDDESEDDGVVEDEKADSDDGTQSVWTCRSVKTESVSD